MNEEREREIVSVKRMCGVGVDDGVLTHASSLVRGKPANSSHLIGSTLPEKLPT